MPSSPFVKVTKPQAPVARRIEHREVWHGEVVDDPYSWLREKADPEVRAYLEAENAYTDAMTENLGEFRDQLYQEMLNHIKQTDLSVPVRRGQYLYYTRTEEGKQYPIHCRRIDTMDAAEQVLIDLNEFGAGHPFIAMDAFVVSDDQQLLAYSLDYTGFRQYLLQVKDLRTGEILPDTIQRVTSIEWAADNRTLFVTTEDAVTKRSDKLLRHELGTHSFDLLYEERDELYDISLHRARDRKFLFLLSESKDTTEVRYLDARTPDRDFVVFRRRQQKHRYYVDHREDLFYIRTNRNAKDFEVMTAAEDAPQEWQPFVPAVTGHLIEEIDLFKNFVVLLEKADALNHLRIYDCDAQTWRTILFPEPVYSAFPGITAEYDAQRYRYTYQSFVTPPSVYEYDFRSGHSELMKRQEVPGYDPSVYRSERLWAPARDGAIIPLSIVYRKEFQRDGMGPLFLYAYGSYGIGMSATFSSARLALLDRGVAFAIAHIRGGDELGEQWREDGMLMKKKNTFFDFVDSAEYLIQNHWTSNDRLAIEGGSAGGLLMGAVVNLRPDLFRAVHAAVPFVDVMNTMMDATLPLTVGEYLEWGNPNEKPAYDYMRSYSPYDNLRSQAYPAMLVTTSLNDSQVMYWEPAKYVARLRTLKTDGNQLLLKIKMDPAGHGGASGRYDKLHDTAFEYAWILSRIGITR